MAENTMMMKRRTDVSVDVVQFVDSMLLEAANTKVSDIHIEPYPDQTKIRFRKDGALIDYKVVGPEYSAPMVSRLKIMAQLDISEKRHPQDGRMQAMFNKRKMDYRISVLPTMYGEKVVLRLLDSSALSADISKLGFEEKQIQVLKEGVNKPYGMVLVTGPTGSGKTTTLYSLLLELNKSDSNITTVEDPVEFTLDGATQVNIKNDIGFNFASALKSILRQDPDVIMLGEIREQSVCEIAIEAALTGHMVLSTMHTNDAVSTISRLLNLGIEPFLIVASINVIVAQRLCRRICPDCKEVDASANVEYLISCGYARSTAEKVQIFKGKGCPACHNSGYKGRVAIYEVLEMNAKMKDAIMNGATEADLKVVAKENGMKTLRTSALTKVAMGQTTLEEAVANSIFKKAAS